MTAELMEYVTPQKVVINRGNAISGEPRETPEMARYNLNRWLHPGRLFYQLIMAEEALLVAQTRGESTSTIAARQNLDRVLAIPGANAARRAIMGMYGQTDE